MLTHDEPALPIASNKTGNEPQSLALPQYVVVYRPYTPTSASLIFTPVENNTESRKIQLLLMRSTGSQYTKEIRYDGTFVRYRDPYNEHSRIVYALYNVWYKEINALPFQQWCYKTFRNIHYTYPWEILE